jgi:hypothetical protein
LLQKSIFFFDFAPIFVIIIETRRIKKADGTDKAFESQARKSVGCFFIQWFWQLLIGG